MEKKKIKFNIVDFIVFLAVIALVFAAFVYFAHRKEVSDTIDEIQYVLEVDNVESDIATDVHSDVNIYTDNGNTCIGKIESVSTSPSYLYGVDKENNIVKTESESNLTLYLTVTVQASETELGRLIDNKVLLTIGKSLDITSENISATAKCVSLQTKTSE